jgi:BASS family bile acid:Na+ symporter
MLKKVLNFYTKYFAVWVLMFGGLAYIFSKQVTLLKPGMSWFFSLTMFGIGVVLEVKDFKRIAKNPVIVLIGSVAQFTIMPFGAFFLAKLFGLPDVFAVGLILTGSAPGAMSSNVMCYIAKADTAYSVSLTTVSTLLAPLLTPGLTLLLASSMLKVPFLDMLLYVMQTVIVPLFIGFGVRHYFKQKVEKILPIFPAISVTFIIFICSLVIALNKEKLGRATWIVLVVVVLLNIYGLLSGYAVGSIFKMGMRRRRTLTIEIGMQNAGLGTTLALAQFEEMGPEVALPAAIFVFICIITASAMVAIWQRTTADLGRNPILDGEKDA